MTTVTPPICLTCAHYNRAAPARPTGDTTPQPLTCTAYPEGILASIIEGVLVHTEPLPGDNGIQYSPATTEAIEAGQKALHIARWAGVPAHLVPPYPGLPAHLTDSEW